jgi:hypothetical protein
VIILAISDLPTTPSELTFFLKVKNRTEFLSIIRPFPTARSPIKSLSLSIVQTPEIVFSNETE